MGELVGVTVAEALEVRVAAALGEPVALPVPLPLPQALPLAVADAEAEAVAVPVEQREPVALPVALPLPDAEALPVPLAEPAVLLGEAVPLPKVGSRKVTVGAVLGVVDTVADTVEEGAALGDNDVKPDGVGKDVADELGEDVEEPVAVARGLAGPEAEDVAVGVAVTEPSAARGKCARRSRASRMACGVVFEANAQGL